MRDAGRCSSLRVSLLAAAAVFTGAAGALLGSCGPFTDVANDAFCPPVLTLFYLGITTGTTPTTYDPNGLVNRIQMATFLSRAVNHVEALYRRGFTRGCWTTTGQSAADVTTVGLGPRGIRSDGADLWTANQVSGTVSRVRESDLKHLEDWTGASNALYVTVASGKVMVLGTGVPSKLYSIDPSQPAGAVTVVSTALGNGAQQLTFGRARLRSASNPGRGSILTPAASLPWTTSTLSTGFFSPFAIEFDASNIWVTDGSESKVHRLDSAGAISLSVSVGLGRLDIRFDGVNPWVVNSGSSSVSVVNRSGSVLATLTGNGLNNPQSVAVNGEYAAVVNSDSSISYFDALTLEPRGLFGGIAPLRGIASDSRGRFCATQDPVSVVAFRASRSFGGGF